jgi:5-methylcytosine-specific restriction endonuclease McrA
LNLIGSRDRDYLRAPSIFDLHARTGLELDATQRAIADLLDAGVVRITIELAPDVLFGHRYRDPVTRPPKSARQRWKRKRRSLRPGSRRHALERFQHRCQNPFCQTPDAETSIDHFVAFARIGTNHRDNLTVLCDVCNHRKRRMLPGDFMSLELATRAVLPDREEDLRGLRGNIRRYLEQGFGEGHA